MVQFYMKRIHISLLAILFWGGLALAAQGQQTQPITFKIFPGEGTNVELLTAALQKCNFEAYRQPDVRTPLHFTDGAMVELFSATEMETMGLKVNRNHINQKGEINYNAFTLHPDGYILEEVWKFSKEELAQRQRSKNNR